VDFVYDTACVVASNGVVTQTTDLVIVQLERVGDRWYINDASVQNLR
jgi:hypothetical protein